MIKSRLYEKQICFSSIQVKKNGDKLWKTIRLDRFQTQAPNDYNEYYDELAGEFDPDRETKKYFEWMKRRSLLITTCFFYLCIHLFRLPQTQAYMYN